MALSPWINWDNGDQLLDVRNKLNTFNTDVNSVVDQNTVDIGTNALAIAGANSSITTLDGRVAQNESDIAQNTADIASNAPFVPTYDYAQGNNITVTDDVYEDILTLTTPSRGVGIYKLTQSMLYSLNSTTTSAYFRFSINGGSTWTEVRREPKDNTDVLASVYTTTIVHPGGVFDLIIQARKEAAGAILTVAQIDVSFERKA